MARAAKGDTLEDVARVLKIRRVMLEALEVGRYDDLPAAAFTAGFVRTYAAHLGLETDHAMALYRAETAMAKPVDFDAGLSFPEPPQRVRVPGAGAVMGGTLMCAAVYAGWLFVSTQAETVEERVADVPNRLKSILDDSAIAGEGSVSETAVARAETQAPVSEPARVNVVAVDKSVSKPIDADGEEVAAAAETLAPIQTASLSAEMSQAFATTGTPITVGVRADRSSVLAMSMVPAATPGDDAEVEIALNTVLRDENGLVIEQGAGGGLVPTESREVEEPLIPIPRAKPRPKLAGASENGRVYGVSTADARVVVRATGESWVQVKDIFGDVILSRILQDGDVFNAPDQDGIALSTGKADNLEVIVDGQRVAGIGRGIVRNVALDPKQLADSR